MKLILRRRRDGLINIFTRNTAWRAIGIPKITKLDEICTPTWGMIIWGCTDRDVEGDIFLQNTCWIIYCYFPQNYTEPRLALYYYSFIEILYYFVFKFIRTKRVITRGIREQNN